MKLGGDGAFFPVEREQQAGSHRGDVGVDCHEPAGLNHDAALLIEQRRGELTDGDGTRAE